MPSRDPTHYKKMTTIKEDYPHRYKPQKESWLEFSIAILYVIGMTSFGSHVVAVVQKITVFAENCNTSATSIGISFENDD